MRYVLVIRTSKSSSFFNALNYYIELDIVGATFAYFSLTSTAKGETSTSITGQTEDVDSFGVATLDQGKENLYMALSAVDMGYAKKGTSYWATDKANAESLETTFVSNKNDEEKYYDISTATIKGGEASTKYRCTSVATITASGTLKDYVTNQGSLEEGKKIVADDGQIKFQGIASTTQDGNVVKFDGETTKTIDLFTLLSADQTINLTYDITTASSSDSVTGSVGFEAALSIKNTEKDQNHMSNKTLTLDIANEEFNCSIVDSFGD